MRKPIPGYDGIYEADEDGSIWRVGAPRNRSLTPVLVAGYHRVVLSKNNIKQPFLVHQLMLLTFVGPCPADQESRHLNGIKIDNRLVNLCWGTRAENMADQIRHGTRLRGDTHPMVKLSEDDIRVIRATAKGTRGLVQRYGVSDTQISRIRARHTWKHI